MAGGLLQLSAYGSENHYLHGNPQITFFKTVYKRHTNFAMEMIEVPMEGAGELSFDDPIELKVKIPRNGDLLAHMYLRLKIPEVISDDQYKFYWCEKLGLSMIDHVTLYIGGQKIETLYGNYMDVTNELNLPDSKLKNYQSMIGDISFMNPTATYETGYYPGYDATRSSTSGDETYIKKFYDSPPGIFQRYLNIPLTFWFSRNTGLALPLLALQYHDVELKIQLKAAKDLYTLEVDDKKYYYYQDEPKLLKDVSYYNKLSALSHYTPKGTYVLLKLSKTVASLTSQDMSNLVAGRTIVQYYTSGTVKKAVGVLRYNAPDYGTTYLHLDVMITNGVSFSAEGATTGSVSDPDTSISVENNILLFLDSHTTVTEDAAGSEIDGVTVKAASTDLGTTAGSSTRITAARERAANRSDTDGNQYKGLGEWTTRIRSKPLSSNQSHHISNFIYGSYVNKTWALEPTLDINYFFLEEDERRKFAALTHQYLIEPVVRIQKQGIQGTNVLELEIYHPVKEILFTANRNDTDDYNEWMNYTTRRSNKFLNQSGFDFHDNWWNHCCAVADGTTTTLITEAGPNTFTHPVDGEIICDRFQELLFRFGPNGEAGDTATDASNTILGFKIESKNSLYSLDTIKKFKALWPYTAANKIPSITASNIETWRANPLVNARLKFNGNIRQETHRHEYYHQVQQYQHHNSNTIRPIYLYSFSLNPDKYQPSGACNMSHVKNVEFELELKSTPISVIQKSGRNITRDWEYDMNFYVIGYNILRIMGGMGGLAYAL